MNGPGGKFAATAGRILDPPEGLHCQPGNQACDETAALIGRHLSTSQSVESCRRSASWKLKVY